MRQGSMQIASRVENISNGAWAEHEQATLDQLGESSTPLPHYSNHQWNEWRSMSVATLFCTIHLNIRETLAFKKL